MAPWGNPAQHSRSSSGSVPHRSGQGRGAFLHGRPVACWSRPPGTGPVPAGTDLQPEPPRAAPRCAQSGPGQGRALLPPPAAPGARGRPQAQARPRRGSRAVSARRRPSPPRSRCGPGPGPHLPGIPCPQRWLRASPAPGSRCGARGGDSEKLRRELSRAAQTPQESEQPGKRWRRRFARPEAQACYGAFESYGESPGGEARTPCTHTHRGPRHSPPPLSTSRPPDTNRAKDVPARFSSWNWFRPHGPGELQQILLLEC